MDRRRFLLSLSALPVTGLLDQLPQFKRPGWELQFCKLPNDPTSFIQNQYEIIKGPYSVKIFNFEGTRDYHNLCATLEMAHLIKHELEYGKDGLKELFNCDSKKRSYLQHKLRRSEISKVDHCKIILFCNKMYGEHDCCLSNKRDIWSRVEKFIHKTEPDWKLEIVDV